MSYNVEITHQIFSGKVGVEITRNDVEFEFWFDEFGDFCAKNNVSLDSSLPCLQAALKELQAFQQRLAAYEEQVAKLEELAESGEDVEDELEEAESEFYSEENDMGNIISFSDEDCDELFKRYVK